MNDELYVIWSFEHNAWWRPARLGYTAHLAEAGRYSKAESDRIVTEANRYSRYPNEQALPLTEAARSGRPAGLHRVAPGVYDDGHGGMHIDVAEMLHANGYADTPENRETLIAAMRELAPAIPIHIEE